MLLAQKHVAAGAFKCCEGASGKLYVVFGDRAKPEGAGRQRKGEKRGGTVRRGFAGYTLVSGSSRNTGTGADWMIAGRQPSGGR